MMKDHTQFLGTYLLPWFYFCEVQIFFKFTRSKVGLSHIFMENSDEHKSAVINRFIDTKVNVGRRGILDIFRERSRTVIEKRVVEASSMFFKNNAIRSLTHGFINSLQPCVLASSRSIPIMSSTPFATCKTHGFTSYLSLKEIEQSKYYTCVEIRSPRPRVVHRYMDCELEFQEDQSHRINILRRAEQERHIHLMGYKDRFLPSSVQNANYTAFNFTLASRD